MPHTILPDGWRIVSLGRIDGGCLLIALDYRDTVSYRVVWHTNDTITASGRTVDGKELALDTVAVMLAMMVVTERAMTPNFSLRAWHPGMPAES